MKKSYEIEELFDDSSILPSVLMNALSSLTGDEGYRELSELKDLFEEHGWSFDYGLGSDITEVWNIEERDRFERMKSRIWNRGDMNRAITLRGAYEQFCAGSRYMYSRFDKFSCEKRLRKGTNLNNPSDNIYEQMLNALGTQSGRVASL